MGIGGGEGQLIFLTHRSSKIRTLPNFHTMFEPMEVERNGG